MFIRINYISKRKNRRKTNINSNKMPKSRKERPSSTPGRQKNDNCQKSQTKNKYCNDTRWYKKDVENYRKACLLINSMKGNQKSAWAEEA
jgi:hypothetical protein